MTCYFRYIQDVFRKVGIEVTKDNKRFEIFKIIHVKPKINRKVVIYQTSDFLPRLPETRREIIMLAFDV